MYNGTNEVFKITIDQSKTLANIKKQITIKSKYKKTNNNKNKITKKERNLAL